MLLDERLGQRFAHVVILEDNDLMRRALTRALSGWDCEVREAGALCEAGPAVAAPLDLLIADVRLPDGTSHPIFAQASRIAPLPLMIAISGEASAAEGFELARLGAHAFLPKPFTHAQLERCIAQALELRARVQATAAAALPAARDLVQSELACFARLHGLTARQTQVLELLLRGVRRPQLPAALGVSPNTCKTVLRRLLARCQAEHVGDLVQMLVVRLGGQGGDGHP